MWNGRRPIQKWDETIAEYTVREWQRANYKPKWKINPFPPASSYVVGCCSVFNGSLPILSDSSREKAIIWCRYIYCVLLFFYIAYINTVDVVVWADAAVWHEPPIKATAGQHHFTEQHNYYQRVIALKVRWKINTKDIYTIIVESFNNNKKIKIWENVFFFVFFFKALIGSNGWGGSDSRQTLAKFFL